MFPRVRLAHVVVAVALVGGPSGSLLARKRPLPAVTADAVRVQPLEPGDGPLPPPWLVMGRTDAHPIASISKLVAMMVVLDRGLDLEATTRIEPNDHQLTRRGARSRLRVGATYRNRDLVTAALLSSDNRAVIALGRAVGLSPAAFAQAMTAKARSVGLKRVGFGDPTGLSYDNVASPEGIVLVLRAALTYDLIRRETSRKDAKITPAGKKTPVESYVNTNRLVRWGVEGIEVSKTGFNREAGHCVAFALRLKDGRLVAVVVLGSRDRNALFRDASRVVTWVRDAAADFKPEVPPPPEADVSPPQAVRSPAQGLTGE